MITFDEICYFDTETCGLPPKGAKWDIDFEQFPRICQLSWIYNGKEENHIIRPDGWEIPQEATEVHGITTEYALEHGESFNDVVGMFMRDALKATLICGHNIYFDTSIIKANILREFGAIGMDVEQALHKGKRIDTMRPAMKWVDARFANGRLKFPKLEELYSRCFPGESFPAHDAIEDVRAVVRCLPVLVENGIIELVVKEYSEEKKIDFPETPKNAPISCVNSKDDKIPSQQEKAAQGENSPKITNNDTFAAMMADENF